MHPGAASRNEYTFPDQYHGDNRIHSALSPPCGFTGIIHRFHLPTSEIIAGPPLLLSSPNYALCFSMFRPYYDIDPVV
ncbi:hypothetical protein CW304_28750 [Bacillus sp. UFRGS-B20]|nr:hypothetical protein CW304_28750 [Bacillus sp. UFRGS-B20]